MSQYTNPTGSGYLGTHKLNERSITMPFRAGTDLAWDRSTTLWAVRDEQPGVAIVSDPGRGTVIDDTKVNDRNKLHFPAAAGRELAVDPNDEVRSYYREAGVVRVVPADPDPFVEEQALVADGGFPGRDGGPVLGYRADGEVICVNCAGDGDDRDAFVVSENDAYGRDEPYPTCFECETRMTPENLGVDTDDVRTDGGAVAGDLDEYAVQTTDHVVETEDGEVTVSLGTAGPEPARSEVHDQIADRAAELQESDDATGGRR